MGRRFAALVAASAGFGLAVQFGATLAAQGSPLAAAWILLRFFTVLVNGAAALCFAGLALGRPASPALLGGLTLNALLVAVVYHLLLAGTVVQSGPERLADLFLHSVTPALVLLHWLVRARHGLLGYRDVAAWARAPLVYLAYALARGASDGIYPYGFVDPAALGWAAVARNAAGIAAGFLVAGTGLVWIDRRLAGARPP